MQIVIDIPEEKYDVIKSDLYNTFPAEMREWGLEAIKNGIVLPKGHGRLKDVDAIIDSLGCSDSDIYVKACLEEDVPTIIGADKESEG